MIEHVIEAMIDAVLVVDVEGRVTLFNTAAARLTGYTPEQIRGMPVAKLLQDDGSGLRTVVRRRIQDGASMRKEESWLIAHDGARIPVSITGSPVHGADGELFGIVLVARDVREVRQLLADKEAEIARRARAEDELRTLNATIESQLEQARSSLLAAERRATLGTLAGGVGHELRNIAQIQVAAIDELSAALDAGEDVTELSRALLHDLERVGDHITTHANRLVQLAQPGPERIEQLDLSEIVRDVILMLRGAGKLGRLDVRLDLADRAGITANRVRVEQVIFNLVVNAVDAIGDARGAITIRTYPRDDGRVACSIRDTGSGIAPDHVAKIFEPLFTTKGDRGTGFGLTVARDIVDGYHGQLAVDSKVGEGTTFTFDLPR